MTIIEVLDLARELLQSKGRITYQLLKLQFHLDDEQLDAIKNELLFSFPQVRDEDGRGLVWIGEEVNSEKDKGIKSATPIVRFQVKTSEHRTSGADSELPPVSWTPAPSGRAHSCRTSGAGSAWGDRR